MKATDKPLTLQECKDKVAIEDGFRNWAEFIDETGPEILILQKCDEAAELYKDSALENLKAEMDFDKRLLESANEHAANCNKEIEALKQALKKVNNIPPYL